MAPSKTPTSFNVHSAQLLGSRSEPPQRTSSRYVGVCKRKAGGWGARIWIPKLKKLEYLGNYTTEEEAARAYDERARPLGKRCNFPPETQATIDLTQASSSDGESDAGMYAGHVPRRQHVGLCGL